MCTINSLIIFNTYKFLLKFYKKTDKKSYIIFNLYDKKIYLEVPNNIFIIFLKNKILCFSKKHNILKFFKFLIYNKILLHYFSFWQIGFYIYGLGFKFLEVSSKKLILRLGFSHEIIFNLININIKKSKYKKNSIILTSNNKDHLLNIISVIKKIRYPDVYKGRGIRFFWEVLKFKNIETNWNR